ncbi:trypsin-like serine peptidase [Lentzea aerocolonigenes]|uniref:trypsin-like serine peptidase n=1 Tax=Lentzea aerocolonigenes TaxID=68170 RepID=UPI000AEB0C61|nr:trypsin-like serine protease [Lentzea aerocolonigenes]MCP2242266.1 Trypsin [Lentzea aerocolonigenes]
MSRRFKPVSAVLAAACCTLALVSPGTSAATAASETTSGIGSEPAGSVDAYWTEARMQQATPMVDPSPPNSDTTTTPTEPDVSESGDGDAGPADTLAAQSDEALAYFRTSKVWAGHGRLPARSIGKLYMTHSDGSNHYCTATVISASNHNTIWTAGHCVSNGHRGWYKNFKFAPDYHNGSRPYGTWTAKAWSVPTRYHDGGDHYYDMAALALNSNSRGKVGDVVGWQGYKFGRTPSSATYGDVRAFGYAQNTHPARSGISSSGEDLRYCVGSSSVPGYRSINCDLGSGASGGPWIYDLRSRGWGYVIGSHSFHVGSGGQDIYSPPLGQAAINVRADVQAR